MSAFDDEFGLFGDEGEDEERKSTLGARTIATGETIIDEIEPEDERPARRRSRSTSASDPGATTGGSADRKPFRRRETGPREKLPDAVAYPRAVELLTFLAKRLVSKPEAVAVSLHPDERGAVLELEVDPEDFGKVIGRAGRVAQALRTIVRAGAEGRVTVDIIDTTGDDDVDGDDDRDETEIAGAPAAAAMTGESLSVEDEPKVVEDEPKVVEDEPKVVEEAIEPARKSRTATPRARKAKPQ